MPYTVKDLLQALDGLDPDTPIILATQERYPQAYKISSVAVVWGCQECGDDEECEDSCDTNERVIICEGSYIGYGNKEWWSL